MNRQLQQEIETAIAVLKQAGATEVYLFGSSAEDSATPHSDIDLAVRGLPPEVFFAVVGQIQMAISQNFDLLDMDERNPFTEFLEQKGKLKRVA